jgi:hypothetical protein
VVSAAADIGTHETKGPKVNQTMDFDKHVFISYAHIDDRPLSPEQQGGIGRFLVPVYTEN